VIAYGFRNNRIPVAQSIVHKSPVAAVVTGSSRPGRVHPEIRALLQSAVNGPIKFYVGLRAIDARSAVNRIEVATIQHCER